MPFVSDQRGGDPLGEHLAAIGQLLRAGRATEDRDLVTVIGVVEDVDELDFLSETWYRPYAQDPRDYNTEVLEVFVRSELPCIPATLPPPTKSSRVGLTSIASTKPSTTFPA